MPYKKAIVCVVYTVSNLLHVYAVYSNSFAIKRPQKFAASVHCVQFVEFIHRVQFAACVHCVQFAVCIHGVQFAECVHCVQFAASVYCVQFAACVHCVLFAACVHCVQFAVHVHCVWFAACVHCVQFAACVHCVQFAACVHCVQLVPYRRTTVPANPSVSYTLTNKQTNKKDPLKGANTEAFASHKLHFTASTSLLEENSNQCCHCVA